MFRDCLEAYQRGYVTPGSYLIDPKHNLDDNAKLTRSIPVYCKDGWTYVMKRGGGEDELEDVVRVPGFWRRVHGNCSRRG